MFAFTEKYNTALKVLLGLISLSFVGFGVSSYSDSDSPDDLAKVDGEHIRRGDLMRRLNERQTTPDAQRQVLEELIAERLRVAHARHLGLAVSDAQLAERLAAEPAFQENGKFSPKLYQHYLESQHLASTLLESRVRQDLLVQQMALSTFGTGFVPQTAIDRFSGLFAEQRSVAVATLVPEQYRAQVQLPANAAKQYYDSHQAEFKQPEQVRIEYLALSQQDLAQKVTLDEAEVKKYFDEHKAQLAGEERKARHILLTVDAGASAADKAKVKAKAEELLQQAKQNPGKFAELARQHSQDPGSAANGGDLGFVGRGVMVKPFDAAMFAMQKGEIRGLVETQFGFHILLLDDIKTKGFDDVRPQIETQLRNQKATQQMQGVTDKFSDLLYQQADSLQPAAKEFGLTVRQSDWLSRGKAADAQLNNPKLLEALFSDDVLKKKHNSEPVDVGSGTLIAARVIEHRPESLRPFAAAEAEISAKLSAEQAQKLALKDGQAKLADLQAGKPVELGWKDAVSVSRMNNPGWAPEAMRAVFKASAAKLPVYAGYDNGSGYTLYRVEKVTADALPNERRAQLQQLLERSRMESEAKAYLGRVTTQYKVEVNNKNLSKLQ